MGLQFEQDAWDARILSAPISKSFPAYPLTASIHLSDIKFDEILVAVLLQACIGGLADMFRVQQITSYCFRFFVPSVQSMNLLLRQPSIKVKRFTLVFDHIDDAPAGAGHHDKATSPAATSLEPAPQTGLNPLSTSNTSREPCTRTKVCLDRKGSSFKSFVLQYFHSGVIYPLFTHSQTAKSACIWVSFISEKVFPCAFIVKSMLDHHFSGSDAFNVTHIHGCIFRTIVSSKSVITEILLQSPIKLPGITFTLTDSLVSVQNHVQSFSHFENLCLPLPAQPTINNNGRTSILGRRPSTLGYHSLPISSNLDGRLCTPPSTAL
jgi:hypothetical protein